MTNHEELQGVIHRNTDSALKLHAITRVVAGLGLLAALVSMIVAIVGTSGEEALFLASVGLVLVSYAIILFGSHIKNQSVAINTLLELTNDLKHDQIADNSNNAEPGNQP